MRLKNVILEMRRKTKKKGPVRAKKITYDGHNFASGLERYMYMALKKAKIKAKYEGETFVLINGFHFENEEVNILIEVAKEYYLLNIRQILLVIIL